MSSAMSAKASQLRKPGTFALSGSKSTSRPSSVATVKADAAEEPTRAVGQTDASKRASALRKPGTLTRPTASQRGKLVSSDGAVGNETSKRFAGAGQVGVTRPTSTVSTSRPSSTAGPSARLGAVSRGARLSSAPAARGPRSSVAAPGSFNPRNASSGTFNPRARTSGAAGTGTTDAGKSQSASAARQARASASVAGTTRRVPPGGPLRPGQTFRSGAAARPGATSQSHSSGMTPLRKPPPKAFDTPATAREYMLERMRLADLLNKDESISVDTSGGDEKLLRDESFHILSDTSEDPALSSDDELNNTFDQARRASFETRVALAATSTPLKSRMSGVQEYSSVGHAGGTSGAESEKEDSRADTPYESEKENIQPDTPQSVFNQVMDRLLRSEAENKRLKLKVESDRARVSAEHAKTIETLLAEHAAAEHSREEAHKAELNALKSSHSAAIAELMSSHAETIAQLQGKLDLLLTNAAESSVEAAALLSNQVALEKTTTKNMQATVEVLEATLP